MCPVPCYHWPNKVYSLLDLLWIMKCTSTKLSAFWDQEFLNTIMTFFVFLNAVMTFFVSKAPFHLTVLRTWDIVLFEKYGSETSLGVHFDRLLCAWFSLQKAVFSENSCMLELQNLWTQYNYFWCFVLLHAFQQLFCMTCWGTSF